MLSLVIPTLNSAGRLARLLELAKSQTRPPDEIIVADSSSDDGTPDIARSLGAKVLTVERKEFDHGGTRSMAAAASSGDLIIFMTDDALPRGEKAFASLLDAFSDCRVGAAYGRQVPIPGGGVFGRALRHFNYPPESYLRTYEDRGRFGVKTPFLSNSFSAYSRKALMSAGWFKSGLILGEDVCAGGRLLLAGYSIAYVASAEVYHSHDYSVTQEFRRYFDIGVFHSRENWLLDSFGRAEGEGGRFVLSAMRFLKDNSAAARVPEFLVRTALKYLGYRLGAAHNLLPRSLSQRLSMHPAWWK
ncbi:MAG TPA: glycosyltransferase family 2 protein [Elusimicrobiales bacterium]|nr:glycosyltransferase family 2 protein [Elusimicrobiales bacterium]